MWKLWEEFSSCIKDYRIQRGYVCLQINALSSVKNQTRLDNIVQSRSEHDHRVQSISLSSLYCFTEHITQTDGQTDWQSPPTAAEGSAVSTASLLLFWVPGSISILTHVWIEPLRKRPSIRSQYEDEVWHNGTSEQVWTAYNRLYTILLYIGPLKTSGDIIFSHTLW